MASTVLRGDEIKLCKQQVHLDIRKYFSQVELLMNETVYQLHY